MEDFEGFTHREYSPRRRKKIRPQKDHGEIQKILNTALCFTAVLMFGVLAWALPQPTYSEYERRDLARMPIFNWQDYFSGDYTSGIESAYSDTFTYRESLVRFSALLKGVYGVRVGGVTIHGAVPPVDEGEEPESEPEISVSPSGGETESGASGTASGAQSSEASSEEEDTNATGEQVNSIFILDKGNGECMGLELFGGNRKAAAYYAEVLNKYRSALPDSVNIYDMVVPTHCEFALPSKYQKLAASEKDNIDYLYGLLDPGITAIDAFSALEAHKSEYIYFNTDHHWTGLGAYYAYSVFAKTAGFMPYNYNTYTKHVIEPFCGTLYSATQDNSLYNNPDSVEWCEIPISYSAYYVYKGDPGTPHYADGVMADYATGGNSYSVYLGGDFPLICTQSDLHNGRKALIIKESYGNAVSTYILSHFEETYIIDERYYTGNVLDLVNEAGITDVIIVNNVFAANTYFHIENIEDLLTNPSLALPASAQTSAPAEETSAEQAASGEPEEIGGASGETSDGGIRVTG